jgi:hypothetical protein
MVVAVQRIGTATATVAVIFGQLAMSLLIDNFGWLDNDAIAFQRGGWGPSSVWGWRCSLFTAPARRQKLKIRRVSPPVQSSSFSAG